MNTKAGKTKNIKKPMIGEENKEEKFQNFKNELNNILPEKKEEKLKFLKREEIRTMKKDIKKLREIETEKERERVMALETEKAKPVASPDLESEPIAPTPEPVPEPEPKSEIPEIEPEGGGRSLHPEALILKLPEKSGALKKVLVRAIFIMLALFCVGLVWQFLISPNIKTKDTILPKEEEKEEPKEEPKEEEKEEPIITIPREIGRAHV